MIQHAKNSYTRESMSVTRGMTIMQIKINTTCSEFLSFLILHILNYIN